MKSTLVIFALFVVSGSRAAPRQVIVPHVINGQPLTVQHAAAVFAVVNEAGEGFFGGGSVISNRHIITGANLVFGFTSVRLFYGGTTFATLTGVTASSVVIHAGFNRTTMDNDIAIAFVPFATPIEFSDAVRPISLPTAAPATGLTGSLAGFGFTQSNAPGFSDLLLVANLVMVENTVCTEKWPGLPLTTQFCANGAPNSLIPSLISNICAGDYGSGFYTGSGFITTTTTPEPTEPPTDETSETTSDGAGGLATEVYEYIESEEDSSELLPFDPTAVQKASVLEEEEQVEPVLVGIASVVGDWWVCNPEDPRTYTIVHTFVPWIQDLTGIEIPQN